jgi:hypothetical protein
MPKGENRKKNGLKRLHPTNNETVRVPNISYILNPVLLIPHGADYFLMFIPKYNMCNALPL